MTGPVQSTATAAVHSQGVQWAERGRTEPSGQGRTGRRWRSWWPTLGRSGTPTVGRSQRSEGSQRNRHTPRALAGTLQPGDGVKKQRQRKHMELPTAPYRVLHGAVRGPATPQHGTQHWTALAITASYKTSMRCDKHKRSRRGSYRAAREQGSDKRRPHAQNEKHASCGLHVHADAGPARAVQ